MTQLFSQIERAAHDLIPERRSFTCGLAYNDAAFCPASLSESLFKVGSLKQITKVSLSRTDLSHSSGTCGTESQRGESHTEKKL